VTGRLSGIDLLLIGLYLAMLLFLAYRRGRGESESTREYLLAGRTLTLPAFVATLVSTWYGGVLGVGEYSYEHGLSNWLALGGPYYLAGLVFAFLLAKRVRESMLTTVPERLLRDHGPAVGTFGAALVFINMLPAAYLLMLGVLAQRVIGVTVTGGILLAAGFCFACIVGSGFRAVVRNNVLQFILMYAAFLIIVPLALWKAGGFSAFATLPAEHLSWDGGLGWQAIAVWYVIALQTLVEPSFYQRCFAAKSPSVARRGILWSVAFWVVFDALTTVTGMVARVLVPDLENGIEAYPALADAILPPVLLGLFYVGLIATVMSTVESYLFVAATTIGFDLPRLWRSRHGDGAVLTELRQRRATRWGLVLATLASIGLALTTDSVIVLWKGVGSVITPALLLPVLGGFFPWLRATSRLTLASMVLSAGVAIAWMVPGWFGHPNPWGIEPIFPALGVSVLLHLPALIRNGP
jgi:SSS family solute:Na+ symporter